MLVRGPVRWAPRTTELAFNPFGLSQLVLIQWVDFPRVEFLGWLTGPQTMTLVLQFFLAMIENPDAMTKAQKEIDSVVGNDRLPTFADRKNLPYIEALFNECLRYSVGVPLCMSSLQLGHPGRLLTVFGQPCHTGRWRTTCTRECSSQRGRSSLQTSGAPTAAMHRSSCNFLTVDSGISCETKRFSKTLILSGQRGT